MSRIKAKFVDSETAPTGRILRSIGGSQATWGTLFTRTATAVDYSVLITDYYIGVTDLTVSRTMTIPLASACYNGQVFLFKDETGTCSGAKKIILLASGADTIDGAANQDLTAKWISVGIVSDGVSQFFVI